MERKSFLLKVQEERLQDYLAAHDPVWPEMLDAMRECGLSNYSLFYRSDGLVVGHLEGEDIAASLQKLGETDANARWQTHMAEFFADATGDLETGGIEWLDQYFHMT